MIKKMGNGNNKVQQNMKNEGTCTNEIKQANDITLEKNYMSFCPNIFSI
jgi:hypothetical protein